MKLPVMVEVSPEEGNLQLEQCPGSDSKISSDEPVPAGTFEGSGSNWTSTRSGLSGSCCPPTIASAGDVLCEKLDKHRGQNLAKHLRGRGRGPHTLGVHNQAKEWLNQENPRCPQRSESLPKGESRQAGGFYVEFLDLKEDIKRSLRSKMAADVVFWVGD